MTDRDQFVSISCRPEFAGHSVEELRLSFLHTGAELTSAQIFAGATLGANPSSRHLTIPIPSPRKIPHKYKYKLRSNREI
ncbi:hypothetical protein B0H17DRAFT_1210542 [Mycena rosella]|uniref:Uncharacterized protein n=1 Tax=Mycena rosella TaxID=1033263 RepID=A0AAD7CXB0_MYCRO|nr:hypothetical protein B0H17DRAFT_1210542 [Mycena rosella]